MTQPETPVHPQHRPAFPMEQLLLTAEQAADVLHVGRTTIFALLRDGTTRGVQIGRCRRITRAELERYVNALSEGTTAMPRSAAPQPPPTPITKTRRRVSRGQADLFSEWPASDLGRTIDRSRARAGRSTDATTRQDRT